MSHILLHHTPSDITGRKKNERKTVNTSYSKHPLSKRLSRPNSPTHPLTPPSQTILSPHPSYQGLNVLLLEKGEHWAADDFKAWRETEACAKTLERGGLCTSEDGAIVVLAGTPVVTHCPTPTLRIFILALVSFTSCPSPRRYTPTTKTYRTKHTK